MPASHRHTGAEASRNARQSPTKVSVQSQDNTNTTGGPEEVKEHAHTPGFTSEDTLRGD